jgi:hypothetical protein
VETSAYQTLVINNFFREQLGRSGQTYQVVVNFSAGVNVQLNAKDNLKLPDSDLDGQLTGEYFEEDGVPFAYSVSPAYAVTEFAINGQPQDLDTAELTLTAAAADPVTKIITIDVTAAPHVTARSPLIGEITNAGQNDTLTVKNFGATPLALGRFCLSSDLTKLCQMPLPQLTLAPGEDLKLFSQNSRTSSAYRQYIFPFDLKAGSVIFLTDTSTGEVAHQLALPALAADQVYSYQPESDTFKIL